MKTKCSRFETTETLSDSVNENSKGKNCVNTFMREGFRIFMSLAEEQAFSPSWLISRTFGDTATVFS